MTGLFKKGVPKQSYPLFNSCDVLPLWNFLKIIETGDYRYLVRISDRFDYDALVIHSSVLDKYSEVWDSVLDEYSKLENSSGISQHKMNKTRLLTHWSNYILEQSMIKSLYFKTNTEYIQELRNRGYKIPLGKDFTSLDDFQAAYWQALGNAAKRVHHHVTHMEMLNIKLNGKGERQEDKSSPFDTIMAWIASNNINIDENITVKRYLEVKKIINNRLKSKRNGTTGS